MPLPDHVDRRVNLSLTVNPITKERLEKLAKERRMVVSRLLDELMEEYYVNMGLVKE